MSDQVAEWRAETVSVPAGAPSSIQKLAGQTLRIDPPDHSFADSAAALPDASSIHEQARRLSEAGQLLAQFQQHFDDAARREQSLNLRQAEFEQEQRKIRLQLSEAEAELAERKTAQQAQEAALAERMTEFEHRLYHFENAAERLLADQGQLEQDRSSLRQDVQRELDEDRATLAAERQALALQQTKVQELGDALLEEHRAQQARVEQQLKQEREQLWMTLNAEWEQKRSRFEEEKAEFLRDRLLLENRLRFQQEHLDKTRFGVDAAQQQFAHQVQQVRTRINDAERQLYFRRQQLDRHRAALEELARALDRQRELTAREREAISSTAAEEHQQYLTERQAWEADRRQQQAELRRQQETLLAHAENLESRRQRLETLRGEVEETNRNTMQLRIAVEDVWAQLQSSLGQASTQERVLAARQEIAHVYEHYQARLAVQRREFHEAERALDQQRMAFLEERRTLAEWLTRREEELTQQELRQRQQLDQQATADRHWRRERDRWLEEKAEAERIIRQLLDDLVVRTTQLIEPDASAIAATVLVVD